jgi:hypothetical protein
VALRTAALLLVQNGVAPGFEAEFDAWYLAEHLPERVAVPGFRRGRRWRATAGRFRDLTCYEIADVGVMRSAAYLERTGNPTAGTRRMMPGFVDMHRSVCAIDGVAGEGDGEAAAILVLREAPEPAMLHAAAATEGVLSAAVLRCDQAASRSDSTESRLRAPDRMIAHAVWIETASAAQAGAALRHVMQHAAPDPVLTGCYELVAALHHRFVADAEAAKPDRISPG